MPTYIWVGGTSSSWWDYSFALNNQGFSNWTGGAGVGPLPGSGDIVEIAQQFTVDIGVAGSTSNLGNISYDDNVTSAGQTIYNSGVVRIDASQTGSKLCTWNFTGTTGISYDPSSTGTGSAAGSILMTDNVGNAVSLGDGGGNAATLIDVDNDISGAGKIVGLYGSTLILGVDSRGKNTTVNANGTHALVVSNLAIVNDGVLESTSAGGLTLVGSVDQTHSTTYNNNPKGLGATPSKGAPIGVVKAVGVGAHVELGQLNPGGNPNGVSVLAGQLATSGGGVIDAQSAVLDGTRTDGNGAAAPVTISGTVNVVGGGELDLTGAVNFTNNSVVNVNASSALTAIVGIGSSGHGGSATLKGSGVINLADVANQRATLSTGAGGNAASLDNQIIIRGAGYLGHYQGLLSLTNEGTIDASGVNSLVIHAGSFANAGGLLEATNSGGLLLQSAVNNQGGAVSAIGAKAVVLLQGGGVVQGGTVSTTGGGLVHLVGGGLDGATHGLITVAGALQVDDNNSATVSGTVNIAAGATITLASTGNSTGLTLTSTTTLSGPGAVVLSDVGGNRNYISDNGNNQTLINQTRIQGAGYIGQGNQLSMTLTNQEAINANGVNGLLVRAANLTNASGGLMESTGTGGLTIQAGTFTNNGIVAADGDVSISATTFANISGSTLTGGTWSAVNGSSLHINSGSAIQTLQANAVLGPGSSIMTGGVDLGQSLTTIASGGQLSTSGATFNNANPLTIQSGGSLVGFGALGGPIVDNSYISVYGGARTFNQNVSGSGAIYVYSGVCNFVGACTVSTIDLDNTSGPCTLDFYNAGGAPSSKISGFAPGDAISLNGQKINSVTVSAPDPQTGASTVTANYGGNLVARFLLSNIPTGVTVAVSVNNTIVEKTQYANDFDGNGASDVPLVESDNDALSLWLLGGPAIIGGGVVSNPGPAWSAIATADVNANGVADVILRNSTTGQLAEWIMNGKTVAQTNLLFSPGGSFQLVGSGDFNGDQTQDVLFRDAAGNLAIWDLNGGAVIGGGVIGNPGAGWTLVGTGDFNGDRKADLLFESASGAYAIWNLNDAKISGAATLGTPGFGWVFEGTGDFNGDGSSDILFANCSTGQLGIWEVKNDALAGGGVLSGPGPLWAIKGVGNYWGNGQSDILFQNTATGQIAAWEMNGASLVAASVLGTPGAGVSPAALLPAVRQELPATIIFQKTDGTLASWNLARGVNSGGATYGNPGAGWSFLGAGNFYGDLQPDLLFQNTSGALALWRTNGAFVGGGTIGAPGPGFVYVGMGDFNGDGLTDLLFRNSGGQYAIWNLDGPSIVSGSSLGSPGSAWSFAGVGDFNGDGTSDILFQNGTTFSFWAIDQDRIVAGGAAFSGPGAGWTLKGVGDFNGDGKSDLLFADASGNYRTMDMSGANVIGGGAIGNPGAGWQFQGVADLFGNHQDSILFFNPTSGAYMSWNLNDAAVSSTSSFAGPGAAWTEKAFV